MKKLGNVGLLGSSPGAFVLLCGFPRFLIFFDLPAEKERHIGVWGQRHAKYLKLNNRILYMNFLTSGRLSGYLASVDALAKDMFFRLVAEYDDRQGATEQLKSEN